VSECVCVSVSEYVCVCVRSTHEHTGDHYAVN
jgi:hypothetical protein